MIETAKWNPPSSPTYIQEQEQKQEEEEEVIRHARLILLLTITIATRYILLSTEKTRPSSHHLDNGRSRHSKILHKQNSCSQ